MSTALHRFPAPFLLSLGSLLATLTFALPAYAGRGKEEKTLPQIARLGLVEGDVRITRGKQADRTLGLNASDAWEKAVAYLPLETGFQLVTGKGRAEIELEDASTLYLGEDSVLVFDDLTSTGDVPHTEITLATGTVTLHMNLAGTGDSLVLQSPSIRFTMTSPNESFVRIDSYLDAVAFTPQNDAIVNLPRLPARFQHKGQTYTYLAGGSIPLRSKTFTPTEWDTWVAEHVAARSEATAAVMKDAGLATPLPGLAELNQQGAFFDCAPYGRCWEPTNGWSDPQTGSPSPGEKAAAGLPLPPKLRSGTPQFQLVGMQSSGATAQQTIQPTQTAPKLTVVKTKDVDFPCSPERVEYRYGRDPQTGKLKLVDTRTYLPLIPYNWTVCHAGFWIRHRNHYAWVAGTKHHHHHPIRWVKYGKTVAYVPVHPRDVAGKPPLNLKNGVFARTDKREGFESVAFDPTTSIKLLNETPKEFRKDSFTPLATAETPHAEARPVFGLLPDGTDRSRKAEITFDRKSQSLQLATQVMRDGKNTTVVQRLDGGGSGRSSGFNGAGGFRGGGNAGGGGVSRSSSSGSGSSSGGSSHASSSGSSSGGSGASAGSSSGGHK